MLLEFWLAALKAEYGIAIQTDNRALLRQHLYKARGEAQDPSLEEITMLLPEEPEDEIWLVHKDADNPGGTPDKGYVKLVLQ